MRRARGTIAVAACLVGASLGLAVAIAPVSSVEAGGPDAGPSSSTDAGPASPSPYLIKAGPGTVLPPSVDDAEAFCALALACLDIAMYPPAPDFQGCVNALMNQL